MSESHNLKGRSLTSTTYMPPQQAKPKTEEEPEGRDSAGRWHKHQTFALQLIWPGKGNAKSVKTILYSWISDVILFDQEDDETGTIILRYANEAGEFEVAIKGSQLDSLHDHIAEGKRMSIRLGDNVRSITQPKRFERDERGEQKEESN